MVELCRDFWIRETGTGQQVTQLHDRYIMMMMMMMMMFLIKSLMNLAYIIKKNVTLDTELYVNCEQRCNAIYMITFVCYSNFS